MAVDPPFLKRPITLIVLLLSAIGLLFLFGPWSSAPVVQSIRPEVFPGPAPASPTVGAQTLTVEDPSGESYTFSVEDLCDYDEFEQKANRFMDDFSGAVEAYEKTLNAAKHRLAVSGDPEHLHAAALLEDDPAKRIELITRALAADRDNAFRAWGAVHLCAGAYADTGCPLQAWQDRLLQLDSENGEAWVQAALIRMSAGAEGAALRAMQRAAAASESRVYWPDTIEMIERAFAAASDMPFRDRVALGADFAGTNLPNYSSYLHLCREQAAQSVDWAYACLRYGELSEREGKTLTGQRMALGIQQVALKALGDEEQLKTVVDRYQRSRESADTTALENFQRSMAVVTGSPTLYSRYLAAVKEHGEVASMAIMQDEAARWVLRHKDLECIP